ncbi:MAG: hypothetical protein V2A54_03435 [Bacteroidota bacterium]
MKPTSNFYKNTNSECSKKKTFWFFNLIVTATVLLSSAGTIYAKTNSSEFYMKEFDEMLIKNSMKDSFKQILYNSDEKGVVLFTINNNIEWNYPLNNEDIRSNARMSMIDLTQGFNGCYYKNLFISTFDLSTHSWTKPTEVEIDPTITREKAEQEIFFSKKTKENSEVYCCYFSKNKCSAPFILGKNINTYRNAINPVMSSDGNTLYFSSNRLGGKGGYDLYASERNSDGNWGIAYNLGSKVNSNGDEVCPIILDDEVTLVYMRKDYQNSMRDHSLLLVSTAQESGLWSDPEQLAENLKNEAECLLYADFIYNGK